MAAGPFVAAIDPAPYSGGVPVGGVVQVTFSEPIDANTLTADSVTLSDEDRQTIEVALAYDAASKRLTITPDQPLAYNTRYTLDLDDASILSTAVTPQLLQGQTNFVFTTEAVPGSPGGGGGGGGGDQGDPDPDLPKPLILSLTYGDPDQDAGGGLRAQINRADGSSQPQNFPVASNGTLTRNSGELSADSVLTVTPTYSQGNDADREEEASEVGVTISVAGISKNDGSNYVVYRQIGDGSDYETLGPLSGGSFTFRYQPDASGGGSSAPETGDVGRPTFKLRDDADIFKGWDNTGKEPWTSVGVGKTNSLVKLVLPVAAASDEELVVDTLSASYIKIGDTGASASLNGKETNLDIQGIAATPSGGAKIILRKKAAAGGAPGADLAILHVDVLPEQTINFNVFYASNSAPDQVPQSALAPNPITGAQIEGELNKVYNLQANIKFKFNNSYTINDCLGAWFSGDGDLHFDVTGSGGIPMYLNVEERASDKAGAQLKVYRIYVVKHIKDSPEAIGETIARDDTPLVHSFVNQDAIVRVYAHEVGHGLLLSTRRVGRDRKHDRGPWPINEFRAIGITEQNQTGLMYDSGGTRWICRDDWKKANETAGSSKFK